MSSAKYALILLLLVLPISACQAEPSTPSPPVSRPTTPSEGTQPRSTPDPAVPAGLTLVQVTRVVDGDTIRVLIDGQEYRLRYIGIDTPETVDPRRPTGCFGKEASERNRQLVEGRMVGLEKDISEVDAFGRLLRYVWVDDQMVNAELIEEGYALAATFPPDVSYSELFAQLQTEAREAGRGLWSGICETSAP